MQPLDPARLPSEPEADIYSAVWHAARDRAPRLIAEGHRYHFTNLLDHLEKGWRILKPLMVRLEDLRIHSFKDLNGTEMAVTQFIDAEILDLFRTATWDAAKMVPSPKYDDYLDLEDVPFKFEYLNRNVIVVALASYHAAFPAFWRGALHEAYQRFLPWYSALPRILEPCSAVVDHVAKGGRMPRVSREPRMKME